MAKKKAKKPARKKLKLRKKPIADLPAKKKRAASVKGGVSLTPTITTLTPSSIQTTASAPPYVPVGPVMPRQ